MPHTIEKELALWRNPYQMYGAEDLSDLTTNDIEVNDTIKPIDRDKANLELEKGEVAFLPNGNIYKVRGKSHSNGGTPANLPIGSFIYSNFKPLSISKKDIELFEFKKGGRVNNTPAKLVSREVDLDYHNQMVAMLESDKHDDISKNSANLMIQKNLKKLGQVAFLQEERKGFPEGIPSFAEGTAPIHDPSIDIAVEQYRTGGFVSLDRYQKGGVKKRKYNDKEYTYEPGFDPTGATQVGMDAPYRYFDIYGNPTSVKQGVPGGKPGKGWEQFIINSLQSGVPIEELASKKHGTVEGLQKYQQYYRPASERNVYTGMPPGDIVPTRRNLQFNIPVPDKDIPSYGVTPPAGPSEPGNPYTSPNDPILPYEPNVPFSPWQKMNLGYAAYNAASIGKYVPKRAQVSFVPLSLRKPNAEAALNAVDNQTAQAYRTNQVLNPVLARANNSSIYGTGLESKSQVLGNLENQLTNVYNTESQYNNQGINTTANQNVQLDQNYYDQVQKVNQNYENEKRMGRNQFVSLANQYKSGNDALELQLASQQMFGSVWEDPRTGKPYPGLSDDDARRRGFVKRAKPLYDYNTRTNNVYYTGAGIDLDALPGNLSTNPDQAVNQFIQYLQSTGADANTIARGLATAYPRIVNPYGSKR